ncbi:MAG: hypothetical protein DI544_04600 [Sphingomonas taxi]|uniref:Uncharacterized protein n=1 Tax=Sphingomonas taxi TaxID=1549858 RepID=A0A2W5QV78_9SPHN|nr:MAG: hypothetical protein DI544_04600 [Sphingomonas taxi]
MQRFLARVSPVRATRDLRFFLQTRERYEWSFFALAIAVTTVVMWAFFYDSYAEKEYRPNIIYFQQWKLDRTDAEIIAQQKIDKPIRDAEIAAQRAREEKLRAGFKRLDDKLDAMGI